MDCRSAPLGRRHLVMFLVCSLLLVATCLSCGNRAQTRVQVRRLTTDVWAGSPAALPPLLEHDDWQDLERVGGVKTGQDGEAELQVPTCSTPVFVTGDSHVQVAACREELGLDGVAPCLRQGTVFFAGTCEDPLTIDTFGGRITTSDAAFSASFVTLRRLTLVIVLQGEVAVQPVFDYRTGELGPGIRVPAGHFLHTMPGLQASEMKGVPAREPRPLGELPAVVGSVFLKRSMEAVYRRADSDGVAPQDWPSFAETGKRPTYLVLLSGGGPLKDAAVQTALVAAIRRGILDQSTGRLGFLVDVGGAILDGGQIAYNPEAARMQLVGAGYGAGFAVELMYTYSWMRHGMYNIGEEIAADLRRVGLDVALLSYEETLLYDKIQQRLEAGDPVLWLEQW